MADFFVWDDAEFGLNVAEMDDEHKELISIMNRLHKSWTEKASYEEVLQNVQDLANFTVKHFADEEIYMQKIDFEGLPVHKIIHQQLLTQFQTFVDEFKSTKTLPDSFFNFLKVWLSGHIRGIDMKYSLASRKAS